MVRAGLLFLLFFLQPGPVPVTYFITGGGGGQYGILTCKIGGGEGRRLYEQVWLPFSFAAVCRCHCRLSYAGAAAESSSNPSCNIIIWKLLARPYGYYYYWYYVTKERDKTQVCKEHGGQEEMILPLPPTPNTNKAKIACSLCILEFIYHQLHTELLKLSSIFKLFKKQL